ncbi:MAG: C-glycoside deglycosidase beta subunit domain-containing protein [Microbacterium gubbeenense]|uniref:C-glycoside deglycosidase beta subunit domain-containing protein n=1 Tax=Microbacterium gubbeenense TaxID=159896 RepID=UPI003F97CB7D
MIPDRIIEQGTLTSAGGRTSVEVRIPWYRALPASCIAGAALTVDGVAAPAESLRWEMNGRTFAFDEMPGELDEWWFPVDSAVLSGDIDIAPGSTHTVAVDLSLYIPYIIIGDAEVLRIEEHAEKTMEVAA